MSKTFAIMCCAALAAGSAAADSSFSVRLVAHVPERCVGGGLGDGPGLLIQQDCNIAHVVRLTPSQGWSGRVEYRGRSADVPVGGGAEFVFETVEAGVWPVTFSATAPTSVVVTILRH
ncbi:MAG: hypothetical protein GC206_09865 [Alphaproteobacteria bacterium]|nr:hypothetical protein [Alphaproteobacteria bacterium]